MAPEEVLVIRTRLDRRAFLRGALTNSIVLLAARVGGEERSDPKWGPFRGRVVDLDRGTPIPGAVAVVVWLRNVPNPVQGHQVFDDAAVGVTDANGDFEIARRRPPWWSAPIDMPRFDYMAPGYVLWNIEAVWKTPGLVQMRRWTALSPEERFRPRGTGRAGLIPLDVQDRLLEAVNAQRKRMGLGPVEKIEE